MDIELWLHVCARTRMRVCVRRASYLAPAQCFNGGLQIDLAELPFRAPPISPLCKFTPLPAGLSLTHSLFAYSLHPASVYPSHSPPSLYANAPLSHRSYPPSRSPVSCCLLISMHLRLQIFVSPPWIPVCVRACVCCLILVDKETKTSVLCSWKSAQVWTNICTTKHTNVSLTLHCHMSKVDTQLLWLTKGCVHIQAR